MFTFGYGKGSICGSVVQRSTVVLIIPSIKYSWQHIKYLENCPSAESPFSGLYTSILSTDAVGVSFDRHLLFIVCWQLTVMIMVHLCRSIWPRCRLGELWWLADCALLIEQSWCVLHTTWNLGPHKFPAALHVPATERLTCVVGCDYYCSWKLLDFALLNHWTLKFCSSA
jgi:hypothetical protein